MGKEVNDCESREKNAWKRVGMYEERKKRR